jgi:hypothetical protein
VKDAVLRSQARPSISTASRIIEKRVMTSPHRD